MTCPPLDLNTTSRCGASQYVEDVAIPNWKKIKDCIGGIAAQVYGYKISVKAVAPFDTVPNGLAQIADGIPINADGDRVLLIAQADPKQNGIWIAHDGNWSRPEDFLPASRAAASFVIAEEGATYADTAWICSTDKPVDLVDLDPLAWIQLVGGGSGVAAGMGLYATPGALNVGANPDGSILVNAADVQVGILATDAQHGDRGGGGLHALVTILTAGFMSAADKIKLDGIASGATNTPLSNVAPVNVTKAAAVAGVAVEASRRDHKHDIDTAAPVDIGTANVEGAATTLARSNHVHNHGNLPGGLLHAIVTAVAPGFTPTLPADSSKFLDGVGNWSTPIPTAGNFGRDFQSAASEGDSTTTSGTWQDKLTMTTPAMTGTYRLGFYFELKSNGSNKDAQGRCYNATDALEVGFDETPTRPANSFMMIGGFQEIVFTGAAKTFKIQYNFNDVSGTATIRRARLELWRVS